MIRRAMPGSGALVSGLAFSSFSCLLAYSSATIAVENWQAYTYWGTPTVAASRGFRKLVDGLARSLDVNTLSRDETSGTLEMNDMGRVSLRVTAPLFVDEYRRNRTTGSFILIDEGTNETVGAGMIIDA